MHADFPHVTDDRLSSTKEEQEDLDTFSYENVERGHPGRSKISSSVTNKKSDISQNTILPSRPDSIPYPPTEENIQQ